MRKTNIFVIPDHKIVFLGVPKCAQTSIKRAFLGDVRNVHAANLLTYISSLEVEEYEEEGYITASVVRNPYDRLYSFWKQKVRDDNKFTKDNARFRRGLPFDETVRSVFELSDYQSNVHYRTQTSLISYKTSDGGLCFPELIGKLEKIDEFWAELSARSEKLFDKRLPRLPHENKTKDDEESPWTPELKELAYRRYTQDFKNFGYPA